MIVRLGPQSWWFAILSSLLPGTTILAADPPAAVVLIDYNGIVPMDGNFQYTLDVKFGHGEAYRYAPRGPVPDPEDGAFILHTNMKVAGVKAEIVDRTKVRVFGYEKGGKFYPVQEASVRSKALRPEQLPKVTNPPKA